MKGIADTGFLVAFANRRDRYFEWAYRLSERVREPLLTCEAVIAETAFHLRNAELAMLMVEKGLVQLAFDLENSRSELLKLSQQYADRSPDLTDLCLIRMSELYPDYSVITIDGDFRIYRRNRRQTIPTIMPPSQS